MTKTDSLANLGLVDFRLKSDLERFSEFAFVRAADCTELIREFHKLRRLAKAHPDYPLLRQLYAWVFVPLTLWPIDLRGFGLHALKCIKAGCLLDGKARLLVALLPELPSERTRTLIAEYEHGVKAGTYETLINAEYKFKTKETELCENVHFQNDWRRINKNFEVAKYQDSKGIIRRRMVQERNFRPDDWKFSWKNGRQRFQIIFDAFCHRWVLYGMEKNRPLLLKLSVNLTPFGTIVFIPRYWSLDWKRDLKRNAITRLHRLRGIPRQGPKLSSNRLARRKEAGRAQELWHQATQVGLKGDRRNQWVMGRLGWHPRTDDSRLRRLLKEHQ